MTATKCKRCFSLPFLSSERSRSTVLVLGRGRWERSTRNTLHSPLTHLSHISQSAPRRCDTLPLLVQTFQDNHFKLHKHIHTYIHSVSVALCWSDYACTSEHQVSALSVLYETYSPHHWDTLLKCSVNAVSVGDFSSFCSLAHSSISEIWAGSHITRNTL